mgnify:CR=1 FL=1
MQYTADVPYREAAYEPEAAKAFFKERPMAVLRRAAPMLAPLLLFVAFEVRACHLSLSLGDEA